MVVFAARQLKSVLPPKEGRGAQHPPFYQVSAAQDIVAMYVPRHTQLQGAQFPPFFIIVGETKEKEELIRVTRSTGVCARCSQCPPG